MKLLQIPPDIIDRVWSAVAPLLERAIAYSKDTSSLESVKERSKNSTAQLWAVIEDEKPHTIVAACLTSINVYPTGKRALLIELLGGDNMKVWSDLRKEIEQWAKTEGCSLVFCWCRKGLVSKLPDMRLTHYVMTKEI